MNLRHIGRTYRVSIDWLFETVQAECIKVACVHTKKQIADMLTKSITNVDLWQYLCRIWRKLWMTMNLMFRLYVF